MRSPENLEPKQPEQEEPERKGIFKNISDFLEFKNKPGEEEKEESKENDIKEAKSELDKRFEQEELEKQKTLERLGVERDIEGKVILYQAVLAEDLREIEKQGSIRPPEHSKKVYLATREEAENIAQRLQEEHNQKTFILEAHVDEANLRPDEDAHEKTWYETLEALRVCPYKGEVFDYNIAEKLDLKKEKKHEKSGEL